MSLVDGLESSHVVLDAQLADNYRAFITEETAKLPEKERWFYVLPLIPEMPLPSDQLNEIASRADIGLLTLGRNSVESRDREVEDDFNL